MISRCLRLEVEWVIFIPPWRMWGWDGVRGPSWDIICDAWLNLRKNRIARVWGGLRGVLPPNSPRPADFFLYVGKSRDLPSEFDTGVAIYVGLRLLYSRGGGFLSGRTPKYVLSPFVLISIVSPPLNNRRWRLRGPNGFSEHRKSTAYIK